jgi:hypothetical protein
MRRKFAAVMMGSGGGRVWSIGQQIGGAILWNY